MSSTLWRRIYAPFGARTATSAASIHTHFVFAFYLLCFLFVSVLFAFSEAATNYISCLLLKLWSKLKWPMFVVHYSHKAIHKQALSSTPDGFAEKTATKPIKYKQKWRHELSSATRYIFYVIYEMNGNWRQTTSRARDRKNPPYRFALHSIQCVGSLVGVHTVTFKWCCLARTTKQIQNPKRKKKKQEKKNIHTMKLLQ